MVKHRVVAIAQIFNEIEKENLARFFKYLKPVVDEIVIYDDCSTDGSYEYALQQTPYVIRGVDNDFSDEVNHRRILLAKAMSLGPDFILWLDGDEVLTSGAEKKLQKICDYCIEQDLDGIDFHELNIWRSKTWRRTDSLYDDGWFTRLWRANKPLSFSSKKKGLHQSLIPDEIQKVDRQIQLSVLHYGFASEKSLAYKYITYRAHGQRGYIMLDRIIHEDSLELERIPRESFPDELWEEEPSPKKKSYIESISDTYKYEDQVHRPKYSIICLIYKSVDWLKFVYEQVLKYTNIKDVEFYFIANDADKDVLDYLRNNYIPHYEFNNTDEHRNQWYINNVYRAYNYGAKKARGDFLIFINSDMCFSPGWLDALKSGYNGNNVISSRLVESGKLRTGKHGIEMYFGNSIASYEEDAFLDFANSIRKNELGDGGLFMPLFIKKESFDLVRGYPEGNLKRQSYDLYSDDIAQQGEESISGDVVLIERLNAIGIKHNTALNSIVYHFQCGEKDSKNDDYMERERVEIAVCNDLCIGIMGEKVLWNFLVEGLPGAYPVDTNIVGKRGYEGNARNYIRKNFPKTSIVIQNATFIDLIDPELYTIVFLQDDLRAMGRVSVQQELNLEKADRLVTNSYQTALSYPEYDFKIIPVGVDENLFRPYDKAVLRKKYGFADKKTGIFVGSFSEVKGWSKIQKCINHYSEVQWIIVSKYSDKTSSPNVFMFNSIDQDKLVELLNCADFFIIGSPVETQCLAAIEANLCNIPVVMPLVGIYRDFTELERSKVGLFGDDLLDLVNRVDGIKFSPRELILSKGLTVGSSINEWNSLLETTILEQKVKIKSGLNGRKSQATLLFKMRLVVRKFLINNIFGDKYWVINDFFTLRSMKSIIKKLLIYLGLFKYISGKRP